MKILTVLGTRPEIIRLSKVISKLDSVCEQILVHTGQSYDENMSGVFFEELNIREPDYNLQIGGGSPANQLAKLFIGLEDVISRVKPDKMLILGDTNSAFGSAYIGKRMGVKVYHMEAGNRCFMDIPEEINRKAIDHIIDIHIPYTERSRMNLIKEGIPNEKIFVTGNPIYEVLNHVHGEDKALKELNLEAKRYFLVTVHREENVMNQERLENIMNALAKVTNHFKMPIVFSRHPRTASKLREFNYAYVDFYQNKIIAHDPFGFKDFITLEKEALCVLSDSGTCQEECCIFKTPCVTLRDVTERQETLECGSNILSGVNPDKILSCVKVAVKSKEWSLPNGYFESNVSDKVARIIMGI